MCASFEMNRKHLIFEKIYPTNRIVAQMQLLKVIHKFGALQVVHRLDAIIIGIQFHNGLICRVVMKMTAKFSNLN